jgi:hypothetical protein
MVRLLYAELDSPDLSTREGAGESLLQINDKAVSARLAKDFAAGDYSAELALSHAASAGNLAMIPALIELVYNGSTKIRHSGSDNPHLSNSSQATVWVQRSVARSTLFPEATRTWAELASGQLETIGAMVEDPALVNHFKDWWEHNRTAILAKDYGNATWLPTETSSEVAQRMVQTATEASFVRRAANEVKPSPAPPVKLPVIVTPAPTEASSALKWPALAVVALAALALGWRFARRK